MPKDGEGHETYIQLNNAARYTIGLPFSQSWENDVIETLQRLEHYENEHGLENKSHDLLENAILDKLALQDDMPADELESYLLALGVPIETGGEVRHEGKTPKPAPNENSKPRNSKAYSPEPKAARIIASLVRDHGIDPAKDLDIKIIPQESNHNHKEPYWIIGVKPWQRQIAVYNVEHEGSYVGKGIRSIEEWEKHLSNKTQIGTQTYQEKHSLINIPRGNITKNMHAARLINACKGGVQKAKVTAHTILDSIYNSIAENSKIPAQRDKNILNPHHTFNQYHVALQLGKIEGYPEGSTIKTLLIKDLTSHAQKWRKEKGFLPDENTDEIIDPNHPSLSKITWKQIGKFLEKTKGYNFLFSEEWKNQGFIEKQKLESKKDLSITNASIKELFENGSLPTSKTKTNLPEGSLWQTENSRLHKQGSSLPRFFRATGLKSTEAVYQTTLTSEDFEAAGDSLNEGLEGQPSISLLLEGHPVEQAQRAALDPD